MAESKWQMASGNAGRFFSAPTGFQRWQLTVAWDGGPYVGWQAQAEGQSVQDTLQSALAALGIRGTARPVAAGRTDAGVHAEAMPIHWDLPLDLTIPDTRLARALNAHLPQTVSVLSAGYAVPGFHARFSCLERQYVYRLWVAQQRHPLWAGRALFVHGRLDQEAMQQAAQVWLGEHDFAALATQEDRDTVRRLHRCTIQRFPQPGGELWELGIAGESFLRHMVRGLVGTLLTIGQGKRPIQEAQRILESKSRAQAGMNVPAHGLYFVGAEYA